MENMYMDLYDRVVEALDEYGILYGDVVDNGDGTINIVGVDESEWDDVVMAIEDLLGLEVQVPSEDHEEFDDELVVIGESLEKESCVKYTKPTKEDIDEWDPDFDICCKDVADGLDSGRWHGQTSSERSWGLIVNGGDGSQFSPLFADVVAYEISYPVRDGLFSYNGLDCVPNKSTFSYMSEEDWKDEEKLNTLKNDLLSVGCSEEDIEKFFKDEISEIEFFIDYEIDIDDLEEETDESLKEEKEEKLETFEDKMNFLAKDEQEAIDGYDKIIAMLDSEQDAFVIEQLTKIRIEEEAHKKYLEDVKTNKDLEYTEPLEEPKKEESLKEAQKGFVTFLNLECGVLLAKDHPEFKDYSVSYDHKHGYYDETYLNSLEEDLDLLKESGLKYIKEGVNGTYAILTKVDVQGSMEDNYIQDAIKNIKDGMFIENSVELLDGEQFKASNVIWSAYKDENGEIHENFVDTSVTEGCKKQLKEDINDDVVTKLQSLYDEGDVYFDTANDNGETFLIVDGWEDVHKIQKALRPDFEPKDEYDTSVLDEIFGYQGDGWGFRDSYSKCDSCGNVIQTEPDSYSWTPDFFVDYDKGEIICGDCVRKNPQDYLETLYNNPKKANTILSAQDLIDNGFEKIEGDYENGWYDKHDSPEEILDKALEAHPSATFIFNISSQGQFATKFELWGADLDLDEKLIKEGVSLDNPSLKKGIAYLNRYPKSFGYICSYLNNKTHQQVLVNKGFKTEKELMKYVKEIEKNKDVVDVSVIRQGEQSKYYKAMKKDNESLENLDSSNKVNEEYKAEDVFEFEDDVPMTFGKIVDMMFDELKTSALDDEAYTNTLSDEELEKLAIQYAEDYIKIRKGKKVVK